MCKMQERYICDCLPCVVCCNSSRQECRTIVRGCAKMFCARQQTTQLATYTRKLCPAREFQPIATYILMYLHTYMDCISLMRFCGWLLYTHGNRTSATIIPYTITNMRDGIRVRQQQKTRAIESKKNAHKSCIDFKRVLIRTLPRSITPLPNINTHKKLHAYRWVFTRGDWANVYIDDIRIYSCRHSHLYNGSKTRRAFTAIRLSTYQTHTQRESCVRITYIIGIC